MRYIGIDPGVSGGIVQLDSDGDLITFAMPDSTKFMFNLIKQLTKGDHFICIEKVWAQPNNGSKQAFTFGYNVGQLHLCLEYNDANILFLTPRKWQTYFKLFGIKGKKPLLDYASERFKEKRYPRLTLKTCDAALLALYAKEYHERRSRERTLFDKQ